MFQRLLYNKVISHVPSVYRFVKSSKFSGKSSKSNDDVPLKAHNSIDGTEQTNDGSSESGEARVKRLLQDATSFEDANNNEWATSPYPTDTLIPKDEEPTKSKVNPKDRSILIFPGQGTLKVGIVNKYLRFPGAQDLFEIANEILGYNLLKLCQEGPQEKLDKTIFNQPATVVTSLCALERIREERPKVFESCAAAAGYSVGEITSLIFSGAISVEDGIRLVAARANAMQAAADRQPQGMLSVYCKPQAKVYQNCKEAQTWAQDLGIENPVCSIAVYLYTQGKILGGNKEALDYIEKNKEKLGFSKLSRLPVSGAFHTQLMEPALKSVSKVLHEIEFEEPRTVVYANATARPYHKSQFIPKLLLKQIVSPVKWEQIMQLLYARPEGVAFPRTFDVGSGGRMKTILKLINAKAYNSCIIV